MQRSGWQEARGYGAAVGRRLGVIGRRLGVIGRRLGVKLCWSTVECCGR